MRINTYLHKYLKHWLNQEMIVADCTAGNGNDTLFLAEHSKKVYSFDIQEEAISKTKSKTQNFTNIAYILASHEKIDDYIQEELDCVIFNLGYLPNSDSTITTNANSSTTAILKAHQLLKKNGLLAISIYRGHKGSLFEYHALLALFQKENFNILEIVSEKRNLLEPILYIIQK